MFPIKILIPVSCIVLGGVFSFGNYIHWIIYSFIFFFLFVLIGFFVFEKNKYTDNKIKNIILDNNFLTDIEKDIIIKKTDFSNYGKGTFVKFQQQIKEMGIEKKFSQEDINFIRKLF